MFGLVMEGETGEGGCGVSFQDRCLDSLMRLLMATTSYTPEAFCYNYSLAKAGDSHPS